MAEAGIEGHADCRSALRQVCEIGGDTLVAAVLSVEHALGLGHAHALPDARALDHDIGLSHGRREDIRFS